MGASIHVVGINPVTPKQVALAKEIIAACDEIGFTAPQEAHDVVDSFDDGDVDIDYTCDGEVEYGDGMVIDLSQLPPSVKKLRIFMSS